MAISILVNDNTRKLVEAKLKEGHVSLLEERIELERTVPVYLYLFGHIGYWIDRILYGANTFRSTTPCVRRVQAKRFHRELRRAINGVSWVAKGTSAYVEFK